MMNQEALTILRFHASRYWEQAAKFRGGSAGTKYWLTLAKTCEDKAMLIEELIAEVEKANDKIVVDMEAESVCRH